MVDEGLILRKLSELDEYIQQIKEYEDVTVGQYSSDWKIQRIVERTMQMMIETCVDIAGHIISDKGFRVAKNYADTFRVLHEQKILDKKTLVPMEKMARFRNIIVHNYDRLDAEIVVGILKKNLDDFLAFKDAILTFLKKEKERGKTS